MCGLITIGIQLHKPSRLLKLINNIMIYYVLRRSEENI